MIDIHPKNEYKKLSLKKKKKIFIEKIKDYMKYKNIKIKKKYIYKKLIKTIIGISTSINIMKKSLQF